MGRRAEHAGGAAARSAAEDGAAARRDWALASLKGGGVVARRAAARLIDDASIPQVIVPLNVDIARHDPRASVLCDQDTADSALLAVIRGLSNVATVLAEDQIQLRDDPALRRTLEDRQRWACASFIGDHPMWWRAIDAKAVDLMRFGPTFQRNAFLLADPPEMLGLQDLATLNDRTVESIAASIRAVVVGIYDDDSHLVWFLEAP